ncbi:MAG TPA: FAD-dependent oxidoreductase [Verrucomicrobiota bacterium]|nr:FAD-dependent oxidoreductase [Verrucomicrobiota bacterium]HQB17469.1 FAD-dependent oxidoreductase [Verrucomicrobiota bacterium]
MHPPPPPSPKPKHAWITLDRVDPPKRSPADRLADFRQTQLPYDEATAMEQASRCIQCPQPVCVAACPLHAPLDELLRLTANGQFREAAELLIASHSIPELAAHTCVGGRRCERSCLLAGKSEAVPIRAVTRFLLDYGWKHGLAEPPTESRKGQSVAVLGSGLGGLVAADLLSRRGYAVTVYDSRRNPGGRMMNGLPGFRMDRELVERRLTLLRQRGVVFRMGVAFGQDVRLSDLRREFDAVFLGFGRALGVPLEVPGADLRGVHQALPFICQNTRECGGAVDEDLAAQPRIEVRGRRVVVLGGGDTAMDVLRMAIRCGATDALCIYRRDEASLPADVEEYENAREEGARFLFLAQPLAVHGNAAGQVTQVRCIRMQTDQPDADGRTTVCPVAGSEFDVPADVVFVAYGFVPPRLPPTDDFAQLVVDAKGDVQVDAQRMTNLPGVFAGGSIVHHTAPLSEVVRDAREASAAMDRYLTARRIA